MQSKTIGNDEILEQDDSHIDYTSKISSKEVFMACGGRTAHKGARHGIKQKGNLKGLKIYIIMKIQMTMMVMAVVVVVIVVKK